MPPRLRSIFLWRRQWCVSKPLELYIRQRNFRDMRPTDPTGELHGPYLATTIAGVRASLTTQAQQARSNPTHAPPHSAAIEFCSTHPDFAPLHMKLSGCQSAVAIPKPCTAAMLPLVTDLCNKAADIRGEVLREAAWDSLFLFPILVLGPQKPGISSSAVKSEVAARLDLWNRGLLDVLVAKAKANIRSPSDRSKTQRATRRAAQLLRKKQFSRAAALAGSLGVADATEDTINGLGPVFPDPSVVDPQDLMDYYGLVAPPWRTNPRQSLLWRCFGAVWPQLPPLVSPQRRLEEQTPSGARQRPNMWFSLGQSPHRDRGRRRSAEDGGHCVLRHAHCPPQEGRSSYGGPQTTTR